MPLSRVDIHQHFLPDYYRSALERAGLSPPDGMGATPAWDEDAALSTLDRLKVGTAFLSISSPGVHFGNHAEARDLARRTNEDAARLAARHPDRFGFFASTPLPDIEGALAEIGHAFDKLGADGIVFETNFHGVYLGDAVLKPVYEELNRRKSVLFLHPTSPRCRCTACTPAGEEVRDIALGYPRPMMEFLFETTRTVTQMMLSGTLARYPDITLIVPHAGAMLPVLAGRIELLMHAGVNDVDGQAPKDVRAALRRLHYDLAGAPVPELLGALLQVADPSRLHYGSDWPFTPIEGCERLLAQLEGTPLLGTRQREAMFSGNPHSLFSSRLRSGRDSA